MQHRRSVRTHEERRLLDRVMADRDDEIGPVDRPMDIVAHGQRRGPHVERGAASDRALAHLLIEERDLRPLHERRQRVGEAGPACGGAEHDERPLGGEVDIRILGETRRAVVIAESPYEPANASLRAWERPRGGVLTPASEREARPRSQALGRRFLSHPPAPAR